MSFLATIGEGAAQGRVAEQYEGERSSKGYVPNYVPMFSLRPDVYDAWAALISTIRGNMNLRDLIIQPPTDDVERAVMDLAAKVAHEATSLTQLDIDTVRGVGLTDEEILDVILASAARAFFTKVTDATGTRADNEYRSLLGNELTEILAIGRPIEDRV